MNELILYRRKVFNNPENLTYPGMEKFHHFFKLFNEDVILIDRTGTIKTPIKTKILFTIPEFRIFTKTYEDICNHRAKEILNKAKTQKCGIFVMYSGGIDSTLVIISLLKNASEEERNNITILLSENSIGENPNFYKDHILGKLKVSPSANLQYILGEEKILVTGEHNDQIFGSDVIGGFIRAFGPDAPHKPYDRNLILEFFNSRVPNQEMSLFYLNLFEKVCAAAPVPIDTNFLFFWWINFSLKWQNVYTRTLMYVSEKNRGKISKEYMDKYFCHFYSTEEFQLWSMNNLDKRMKDGWKTYKWVCKDIIYNFNHDAEYRDNKTKVGSLGTVIVGSPSANFINGNYELLEEIVLKDFYNADNDFI